MPTEFGEHPEKAQSQHHARKISVAPKYSKWEVYSLVLIRIRGNVHYFAGCSRAFTFRHCAAAGGGL